VKRGLIVKRLVVVADNSLIIEAIRIGLRQSGEFNVLGHVGDRPATIQKIIETEPDVVLVDDMEQSEAAIDLIRAINDAVPSVSVIALTFLMEPEWLDAIFDAGAAAAISKATDPVSLTVLIRETVDGHVAHIPADVVRPIDRRLGEGAHVDAEVGSSAALTSRELEVLQQAASGASNRKIARNLWITEQTVKFHLANVYKKLEVGNRTQASHYAHVNGLTEAASVAIGASSSRP
jgi:DNA-binding NarL/FixJ family response regulator